MCPSQPRKTLTARWLRSSSKPRKPHRESDGLRGLRGCPSLRSGRAANGRSVAETCELSREFFSSAIDSVQNVLIALRTKLLCDLPRGKSLQVEFYGPPLLNGKTGDDPAYQGTQLHLMHSRLRRLRKRPCAAAFPRQDFAAVQGGISVRLAIVIADLLAQYAHAPDEQPFSERTVRQFFCCGEKRFLDKVLGIFIVEYTHSGQPLKHPANPGDFIVGPRPNPGRGLSSIGIARGSFADPAGRVGIGNSSKGIAGHTKILQLDGGKLEPRKGNGSFFRQGSTVRV